MNTKTRFKFWENEASARQGFASCASASFAAVEERIQFFNARTVEVIDGRSWAARGKPSGAAPESATATLPPTSPDSTAVHAGCLTAEKTWGAPLWIPK